MSRRKQSNPRQIKRAFGEMEEEEEEEDALPREDDSQSENEGGPSDHDGSVGDESPKTSSSGRSEAKENSASPKEPEKEDMAEATQELKPWNGPGELEVVTIEGETQLQSRQGVPQGLSWGPYRGNIHSEAASPAHTELANPPVTLVLDEDPCWLSRLPLVPGESEANLVIYKKESSIWCKTTKAISDGEVLRAFVMAEPLGIPNHTVKTEAGEPSFPSALAHEIQLLPQQAGMAAILATAVVNKDVFPCKDCGIWYRSERNLRAHLTFYCASRQNAASPAVEEKQPKEAYPNERICPFPQCKKSCPSASSLEIHMRSHSGERPFVCLICLSAFTTKANCERHLKVHTDTLSGVCHSCGFISTTRDILYSHLVTNHMICQPGSKGEVYSPGTPIPPPPLNPGLSATAAPTLKCSFCGYVADGLPSLQQHVVLHSVAAAAAVADSEPRAAQSLPEALVKTGTKVPMAEEEEASVSPPQEGNTSTVLVERVPPVQIKEEPQEGEGEEEEEEEEGEVNASRPFRTRTRTVSEPEQDTTSRASSTHSLPPVKVKSEVASPTPGSSPGPTDPGPSSAPKATVFVPQYAFSHEAAVVPQASEILAKMSELVHSRLKQGHGSVGLSPALFPGSPVPKGATCFECEITFNNINNYYVHKRLYCSSRRGADESPPGSRRAKVGVPGPAASKGPPAPGTILSPQLPGEGKAGPSDGEAGQRSTPPVPEVKQEVKVEEGRSKASPSPEVDRAGRLSEDSQSPGASSVEEPEDDPSQTSCEACNIRFSRHETYMVHKRYYCASRHDPPLRRAGAAGKVPFLPQPIRTRKRRKLYEIHAASGGTPDVPRPEIPALIPALISVVKPAPSPGSSPDVDGPIDLSKKPRLLHGGEGLPSSLMPLADYHECTGCSVSFHSLDGYLAHKKYYCPNTPMQTRTLEQLQKIKGAVPALLKAQGNPEVPGEERAEKTPTKVEKAPPSLNPVATQAGLPGPDCLPQSPLEGKASHRQGSKTPLAICPYCPLNGAVKGDLAEHFRNAHGLFVTKTVAGVASVEATQTLAESSPLPSLPLASPPQPPPPPQLRKDSFNGDRGQPAAPLVPNGSPRPSVSPQPLLPVSPPIPLPISPGPEASPNTLPGHTDKSVQTPPGKGPPPALNGNHRFCRLCNIKFSSLSTFIAHKKYYCSSHAAEHIK